MRNGDGHSLDWNDKIAMSESFSFTVKLIRIRLEDPKIYGRDKSAVRSFMMYLDEFWIFLLMFCEVVKLFLLTDS